MVDRSVATADEILRTAVDELVRLMPAVLLHINHSAKSRWQGILAAWRAMLVVCLRRQADEVVCSRLKLAVGQALRELAASEFNCIVDESAQAGIGEVVLVRNGPGPGLVVPERTLFTRTGNPNLIPLPLSAATYESTAPVIFTPSDLSHPIPIRAVAAGPGSNVVLENGVVSNDLALSSPVYTAGYIWSTTSGNCAGGSSALVDDDIRRIATVQPLGEVGPTRDALVAGTLRETGVDHYAFFQLDASLRLFAADESWGSSPRYTGQIIQTLKETPWLGFGGFIDSGPVVNTFIRVEATIQLRDYKYLAFTDDISTNIRKRLRAYFDTRDDWYLWKAGALRSAVSGADRRILACTAVTVRDRNDNVVSEPALPANPSSLTHYYLLADGFLPFYSGPS